MQREESIGCRWRLLAVGTGLALLAGGGWWLYDAWPRQPSPAAEAQPETGPAATPAASLALASAPAPATETRPPTEGTALDREALEREAAVQLKQIEAQWCTHGLQALRQLETSAAQSHGNDFIQTAKAMVFQPFQRAKYAVRDRILDQWAQQLRQQGDERSQATAAYLVLAKRHDWTPAWQQALTTLQAKALHGTDPYVLHLWAKDPGQCLKQKRCQSVPAARALEVEPANVSAWLRALPEVDKPSEAQWRGIAGAQYAKSYEPEFQSRLLALAADLPPGLELQMALEFIHMESARGNPELVALGRACKAPDTKDQRKHACLLAADLLWRQELATSSDKLNSILLAGELGASQDAPWANRFAALMTLGPDRLSAVTATEWQLVAYDECAQLHPQHKRLTDIAKLGIWRASLGDAAAASLR